MKIVLALVLSIISVFYACGETYMVSVGICNYASPKVNNLTKPERDARSMAALYREATPNVVVLTGKNATKSQILSSLRSEFAKASAGDKIIFFFSGHGYAGGFCPYDMMSIEDGLTYNDVTSIMNSSAASTKMIFADECHSGAIRSKESAVTKPVEGNILFFLSSRGRESSLESPFFANGYFTKYLLRGLRGAADSDSDRKITASELFKFVSTGVMSKTRNRQHPVMWGSFPDDLVIVQYNSKK